MSSVPLVDGMAENNRAHPVESLPGINAFDHAPNPIDDRPKKRQKIALACDMCRARKVKCDGIRPACGVCVKRKDKGVNCRYTESNDKTPVPSRRTEYPALFASSSKIDSQTSPSQSFGQSFSITTPGSKGTVLNVSNGIETFGSSSNPEGPVMVGLERLRTSVHANSSNPSYHPDVIEDKSKGIDSMTGIIGEQAHGYGFFGSSSAGSFMRQIKSAVDAKVGAASRRPSSPGATMTGLFSASHTSNLDDGQKASIDYVLPPRKTADSFFSIYWTLVHPLYPFLDRQRLEHAYESIWSGSPSTIDERIFMCTLNVVFALACQLSELIPPDNREDSAKVYFKRAQELLHLDLWDVGSAELIQCLLLMGQYLQSTNTPHRCWMVVGHAIRIAEGLGFHLPETSLSISSVHERELARIVWHGCVLMDRVLSMTFGRPAMISRSLADAVPLPSMVIPEYLPLDNAPGMSPSPPVSMIAFFVVSVKLYNIINDILLELYTGNDQARSKDQHSLTSESFDLDTVLKLDRALMIWGQTLPTHLRISSPESLENEIFQRQSVVCRARFLHSRILLFRPVVARFCSSEKSPTIPGTRLDESLAQRMALQCSTLCLKAAHDLIDLIHTNFMIDRPDQTLPAWWYCILYIYTAATVLLAARLRPVIELNISGYSAASSWTHAIQILKSFERLGQSAQRCVAALEILSAKVSQAMPPNITNQKIPSQHQVTPPGTTATDAFPDAYLEEFPDGFDFSGIDLSDMAWLNSMPGNL